MLLVLSSLAGSVAVGWAPRPSGLECGDSSDQNKPLAILPPPHCPGDVGGQARPRSAEPPLTLPSVPAFALARQCTNVFSEIRWKRYPRTTVPFDRSRSIPTPKWCSRWGSPGAPLRLERAGPTPTPPASLPSVGATALKTQQQQKSVVRAPDSFLKGTCVLTRYMLIANELGGWWAGQVTCESQL